MKKFKEMILDDAKHMRIQADKLDRYEQALRGLGLVEFESSGGGISRKIAFDRHYLNLYDIIDLLESIRSSAGIYEKNDPDLRIAIQNLSERARHNRHPGYTIYSLSMRLILISEQTRINSCLILNFSVRSQHPATHTIETLYTSGAPSFTRRTINDQYSTIQYQEADFRI